MLFSWRSICTGTSTISHCLEILEQESNECLLHIRTTHPGISIIGWERKKPHSIGGLKHQTVWACHYAKMDWYGKQSNQPILIKHTKQRNCNKIVVMRWQLTRRWEILTFYSLTLYPVQVTWGHVDKNLRLKQNCKHNEVRNMRRKSVTLMSTASQCFLV